MRAIAWTLACIVLPASAALPTTAPASSTPVIELYHQPDGVSRFRLTGLSAEVVRHLSRLDLASDPWRGLLSVYVLPQDGSRPVNRPAILGNLQLVGDELQFTPRFPLQPGLAYLAVFDPRPLAGAGGPPGARGIAPVEREFKVAEASPKPPTFIEGVFPSGDALPENLLKFYLHFSAPMRRGEAYRHIRLLSSNGTEVDLPFLELEEELWDPGGRRLTLFFDPGRIKRGLRPREEHGPVLEEGHSYTLVLDREWKDAAGNVLSSSHEKHFRVGAPDDERPDPATWKILAPPAGGRAALTVEFPEPLDHAMLERVLVVTDSQGRRIPGEVVIGKGEAEWRFTPREPWSSGSYRLEVETTLEDRSGNSVERTFEIDVFHPVARRVTSGKVSLPFEISRP